MMGQRVLDLDEGRRQRDEGIERVSRNAPTFLEWARETAMLIWKEYGAVTADDLRARAVFADMEPHHPNAWGAVFRTKGWVPIGYRQSKLPSNHSRIIRVWTYIEQEATDARD